ncbi:MAG: hypothetical protein ACRDQ1_03040, partial [Sciscionella sp.]
PEELDLRTQAGILASDRAVAGFGGVGDVQRPLRTEPRDNDRALDDPLVRQDDQRLMRHSPAL